MILPLIRNIKDDSDRKFCFVEMITEFKDYLFSRLTYNTLKIKIFNLKSQM